MRKLSALEWTAFDYEALAFATVDLSFVIRDDFSAAPAFKVDYFELIAQVAIHHGRIESITLARGTASSLLKPLFKTVFVEDLLTVTALYVLLLYDVKANRTQKRIHKLLITFNCILFRQLIVPSQLKNEVVRTGVNQNDKLPCLLDCVVLQPRVVLKRALVMCSCLTALIT